MKNFTRIVCLLIIISGSVNAQQEVGIIGTNNWLNPWTDFNPNKASYGESTHILSGNITEDTVLYKKNTYLLIGNVFVTNNAVLSIEPGTVILGDFETKATLTITVGSAIIAEGTLTDPIVFTSNKMTKKAGDWGGIIILGDGRSNKFGQNSATSFYTDLESSNYALTNFGGEGTHTNSGFMSHVRIEFAGGKNKISQVSNGLLLAGVGPETTINNLMVSYSAGNSVNVIGGEVNLSQIVSYKAKGNDYNFSYGATSNLSNSLAVRSPYVSSNESRCINAISYENANEVDFVKEGTKITATNMTLLTDSENLNDDINRGLIKESVYIGDNTHFTLTKSVITGFSKAVILDQNIQINDANLAKVQLRNIYFNNCVGNIFTHYNENNEDLENWYGSPSFSNLYSKTDHTELFINLNTNKKPDFRLSIDKIIALAKE